LEKVAELRVVVCFLNTLPAFKSGWAGLVFACFGQAGGIMLSSLGSLKVLLALESCDMRKGFNGLFTAVTERVSEDPKNGALFVFCNRRHARIRILYWDGTGLWGFVTKASGQRTHRVGLLRHRYCSHQEDAMDIRPLSVVAT
jgi:hypothetical protein